MHASKLHTLNNIKLCILLTHINEFTHCLRNIRSRDVAKNDVRLISSGILVRFTFLTLKKEFYGYSYNKYYHKKDKLNRK
jgi:hypothetical protein